MTWADPVVAAKVAVDECGCVVADLGNPTPKTMYDLTSLTVRLKLRRTVALFLLEKT